MATQAPLRTYTRRDGFCVVHREPDPPLRVARRPSVSVGNDSTFDIYSKVIIDAIAVEVSNANAIARYCGVCCTVIQVG